MNGEKFDAQQNALLRLLADGIIPPDDRDAGAGAVEAGPRLAAKIEAGMNERCYREGLQASRRLASDKFGMPPEKLSPAQVHELLSALRDAAPAFFKQLRIDVSAVYLSDPDVWKRIGFPGPSISSGGYPDFNQPQSQKISQLKEPLV